jgi:hypothetical protein
MFSGYSAEVYVDWSASTNFQLVRTGSSVSYLPTGFFQRGSRAMMSLSGWALAIPGWF